VSFLDKAAIFLVLQWSRPSKRRSPECNMARLMRGVRPVMRVRARRASGVPGASRRSKKGTVRPSSVGDIDRVAVVPATSLTRRAARDQGIDQG